MATLVCKSASASRASGKWKDDDYDVSPTALNSRAFGLWMKGRR